MKSVKENPQKSTAVAPRANVKGTKVAPKVVTKPAVEKTEPVKAIAAARPKIMKEVKGKMRKVGVHKGDMVEFTPFRKDESIKVQGVVVNETGVGYTRKRTTEDVVLLTIKVGKTYLSKTSDKVTLVQA